MGPDLGRELRGCPEGIGNLRILHHGGFTHRDVRPSNIIFVNGTPKLADIDLLTDDQAALTSYIPKHYAAPMICGDLTSRWTRCYGISKPFTHARSS
jgi:serine/threonine protein kinase